MKLFSKIPTWVYIVVLMAIAGGFSYSLLLSQSLRLDESQSIWQASHTASGIFSIVAADVHVPLYHLMLHYWIAFFGDSIARIRLLSLFFYVLTIPAVYALGRHTYSKNVALFAAALTAFSPFLSWYGSEARMYSLLMFLAVVNQIYFLKIVDGNKRSAWYGYFFTALFGMYSHYLFFAQLATQLVYVIVKRKDLGKRAVVQFTIIYELLAIFFAPWVYFVLHLGLFSNSEPLIGAPNAASLFNSVSQFIFGFQTDNVNTAVVSLWPLAVLFLFLALQRNQRITKTTKYFVLSFILPVLAVYFFSIFVTPFYLSRYLIFVVPPFYLAIAWLISTYGKYARPLGIVVLAVILGASVYQAVNAQAPVKEDYQGASNYLYQHVTDQDVIIASAPFTIYPLEYYYQGPANIVTLPLWNRYTSGPIPPFIEADLPAQVKEIEGSHANGCLVLSYDQGYEKTIYTYFNTHFQLLEKTTLSPDLSVDCYRFRY